MPLFRVKFIKRVSNSIGHEANICQRVFDVNAPDQDEAVRVAKSRFTYVENTCKWWLRADRIETELVRMQDRDGA